MGFSGKVLYSYRLLSLTYCQRKVYPRFNLSFPPPDMLTAIIAMPAFYNANTTGPSYPNITPGGAHSLSSTGALHYSVYGTKISDHFPNGITAGVSIANGSTNAFANARLCFFVVQDTMSVRFWPGRKYSPLVLSCLAYQCEEYTTESWFNFTVTSVITQAPQYIDTVITNYATSIRPTFTLSVVNKSYVENQLVKENYAPRLLKDVEALNETLVTSWSRTLWVMST